MRWVVPPSAADTSHLFSGSLGFEIEHRLLEADGAAASMLLPW